MFTHTANKPQPFVRISGGGKGREGKACSKERKGGAFIIYALPFWDTMAHSEEGGSSVLPPASSNLKTKI